jgi:CRISPR system Cascade subunit CasE
MYLSRLLIDAGTDPDRPRPGALWLRNVYHVHQRLCMGFPSAQRKADDPHCLRPYRPADFPEHRYLAGGKAAEVGSDALRQVHAPRDERCGFLFRIDPLPGRRAMILVQSALKPDWDYAFHNAGFLLAAAPQVAVYNPQFSTGQALRFRLLANTVFRARSGSVDAAGKPVNSKWVDKRLPVASTVQALSHWLERRGPPAGFRVETLYLVQPGYVWAGRMNEHLCRFRSTRYEGTLKVVDPVLFLKRAVVGGIGPAKAFGFGLLSVAELS